MSQYECGTGCPLLPCCCSADAAVGGGEQCPSADVEGEPSRTAAVGGDKPPPGADVGGVSPGSILI